MLSPDDYWTAGSLTQLNSIDLLVRWDGKYLLGRRTNEPAKGLFFVPGARTYSTFSLTDNFPLVCERELGSALSVSRMNFLGVFDHQYTRNFRDTTYGTHYVVVAVVVECSGQEEANAFLQAVQGDQHSEAKWMTGAEIMEDVSVHPFNKYYFSETAPNVFYRTRVMA